MNREPPELNITAFLNLMIVLVPFLLITAVFSRITVLQLNLSESAGAEAAADLEEAVTIEVIVREDRVQVGDGKKIIAQFLKQPKPGFENPQYDWKSVNALLATFKQNLPDKEDVLILMEDQIKYDYMVQAMDAVQVLIQKTETEDVQIFRLFNEVSFGDAPQAGG